MLEKAPIKVLVSDATAMGCELLADALRRTGFQVLHCAHTREQIVAGINAAPPDVALINSILSDGSMAGLSVMQEIHVSHPATKAVFLLEKHDAELIVGAFRGGARGVFFRADPFSDLCKCLRVVQEGQVWASTRELHLLLKVLAETAPLRPVNLSGARLLTEREEQLINYVAQGLTNREIAQKMTLSENTVKNYLFRIFDKLGVSSRVELVVYSMNNLAAD